LLLDYLPLCDHITDTCTLTQAFEEGIALCGERGFVPTHRSDTAVEMDNAVVTLYLYLTTVHTMASHLCTDMTVLFFGFRFFITHYLPRCLHL
jgi:hypothetical protein